MWNPPETVVWNADKLYLRDLEVAGVALLVEFGVSVLAAASRPWLYARVDVVEARGGPVLIELELIEPQLFLTAAAAVRMADALESRRG